MILMPIKKKDQLCDRSFWQIPGIVVFTEIRASGKLRENRMSALSSEIYRIDHFRRVIFLTDDLSPAVSL